jgi:hypothetical protein
MAIEKPAEVSVRVPLILLSSDPCHAWLKTCCTRVALVVPQPKNARRGAQTERQRLHESHLCLVHERWEAGISP